MSYDGSEEAGKAIYDAGVAKHGALEKEFGHRGSLLHKAYEAAVEELGLDDSELQNRGNMIKVSNLMFSDKYLGNSEFNDLLDEPGYTGFEDKDDDEKSMAFKELFGFDAQSLSAKDGIAERSGGMQRREFSNLVARIGYQKVNERVNSYLWSAVYDDGKSLKENIEAYNNVLLNDPLLSRGKSLDLDDIDLEQVTETLSASMAGNTSRNLFKNKFGIDFSDEG